jgi:hypothetical protein
MQKKKKFDGIAKQALDFPLGSNLRGEAYKGNRAERGGGTCGTKLYTVSSIKIRTPFFFQTAQFNVFSFFKLSRLYIMCRIDYFTKFIY